MMLAEQWCQRMRYFYDIYVVNDTNDFIYSDEQLAGYVPLAEWIDAKANMAKSSDTYERAQIIDSLWCLEGEGMPCPKRRVSQCQ
eukprot:1722410-Lingulodinium_polyedra.AAC.1